MTETKKWLVTGAAGFIGSNLCAYLLREGEHVTGYDNFLTGKRKNIERLEQLGGAAFSFIEGDILDGKALRHALTGADRMVHLAAQVSVQRSLDDPLETNAINVTGFLTALTSAAAMGINRFFYASSCAVYGDSTSLPLNEGADLAPLSPYAVSKLSNEHYAASLAGLFPRMKMTGLRFFNIFGPWQDFAGGYAAVIPRWISLLAEGKQPVAFGDGTATRDFCFVDNVCALIERLGNGPAIPARPVYNVGTGTPVSLNDLYAAICTRLRARGVAVPFNVPDYQPWRPGDIVHSYGDISCARAELGYSITVGLETGIDRIMTEECGIPPARKEVKE